ncbi:MAG: hypothetical protein M1813_009655 [Trichoglossum hirsutum]|nr:MAG: hypothetical protein M1813_009655 [Trichoglossum hirsutum]
MAKPQSEHDLDVDEMWVQAQAEFQKLTGQNPKDFPVLEVGDVLAKIKLREEDENAHTKITKAKDGLHRVLACIQTLGQITAQGSPVFGPVNLCFNALSFLIAAIQKIGGIYVGIGKLFERISAFLERFEVYARDRLLDVHIKRIIHELLRSFMRICAISIKLTNQHGISVLLETFDFGNHDSIQEELTRLETLVQREIGMSVALTLESVTTGFRETKDSLNTLDERMDGVSKKVDDVSSDIIDMAVFLKDSERRRETDDTTGKQRDKIQRALKIENDKPPWRTYQEENLRDRVKDTGQWLLNDDAQFSNWSNAKAVTKPILALEAKEGYGKTFLFSSIVRHLRNRYPAGQQVPRVSVGYYFLQKKENEEENTNKALKALVWQLTESDIVYRKSVAGACDKSEEFGNTLELWKYVVMNLSKTDATFFILLDGIDEDDTIPGKPLLQILSDISSMATGQGQLRIRVLLTGRPKPLKRIRREVGTSMLTIKLGAKNEDDILKYVNARMDRMEILKRSDQPEKLKGGIRVALTEGAQGDFVKLDYKLNEISGKRRRAEIEEVLKHAGEDRLDMIAREVERLNERLGEVDIQELNELLTWVITAYENPTLPLLEALLFVKNGERSLIPLEFQIQDQYSDFLSISRDDGKTVTLISDSITEYFRQRSEEAVGNQASGASADIHESEVNIVKRFLSTVCDEELFRKFGFEEFFKRKLGKRGAVMDVDPDPNHNHVKVILCCLRAICGEQRDEIRPLVEYAFNWLPKHLAQVDLALTEPSPKGDIGSLLIKLFVEEEVINRWWIRERQWMCDRWLYADGNVKIVLSWFKDSAVVKGVPEDRRDWINGLTSNSNLTDDLLKPTTVIMARRWLQDPESNVDSMLSWVIGLIAKIRNRRDENADRLLNGPSDFTMTRILDAEKWAAAELGVSRPDPLWIVRMAITFRAFGFYDDAIERIRLAHELDPNFWRADVCLARIYALQGKLPLALRTISRIVERFRDDEELMQKDRDRYYDALFFVGKWNSELGQDNPTCYDTAMEALREALRSNPDRYDIACMIVLVLAKQGKFQELIEFLQDMNNKKNDKGLSRLIAMYHEFAYDTQYHETTVMAAQRANSLKMIKEAYVNAVEAAKEGSDIETLAYLRFWYGQALFHNHETEEDQDEAVKIWEQNIRISAAQVSNLYIQYTRSVTARKLASIYLQQAKRAGMSSHLARQNIEKLTYLSSKDTEDDDHEATNPDTRLLLARLLRTMEGEESARECMRPNVKIALDLLSDDDPSNDWQGFIKLAMVFGTYGDDVNALAAWSLLGPIEENPGISYGVNETEKEKQVGKGPRADKENENGTEVRNSEPQGGDDRAGELQSSQSRTLEGLNGYQAATDAANTEGEAALPIALPPKDSHADTPKGETNASEQANASTPVAPSTPRRIGPLQYTCDGGCGHTWSFADDLYVCKDCIDVQFERACWKKLKNAALEFRVCDPSHEFLHVPPWDDEVQSVVPQGSVMVGGHVVTVAEWLDGIRKEWGVS